MESSSVEFCEPGGRSVTGKSVESTNGKMEKSVEATNRKMEKSVEATNGKKTSKMWKAAEAPKTVFRATRTKTVIPRMWGSVGRIPGQPQLGNAEMMQNLMHVQADEDEIDDDGDEDDDAVKPEAAAPEDPSDQTIADEMKMIRISEEAAEEEMMMMMMSLGELADEMTTVTKSGKRRRNRTTEGLLATLEEDIEEERKRTPEEAYTDPNAFHARINREAWDRIYAPLYGPFEQTTSIPPSCFYNFHPSNPYGSPQETLQIFSIKVGEIKKPLRWPLDVFGLVAARDVVDNNRIMVFHREKDNCQTLTKKDRNLMLTGPTRGVVASVYPTSIEVDLKVKGATESEDRDLSYLDVASFPCGPCYRSEASKLSTLELTYVRLHHSVEATINVKVKRGSWPSRQGSFTASTASFENMEVLLLDFKGDKLPVDRRGYVELSRRVVCVELPRHEGKLIFSAHVLCGPGKDVSRVRRKVFTPKKAGESKENLKIGSCEMVVSVKWSLLPSSKYDYDKALGRA